MSDIPFNFTAIPNFLIDSGWTDDPKNWKLLRTLFRRCRKDGHVEFVEGRQVYLEPFEFIYGREKTALAAGLSVNETRDRMVKIVTSGLASKVTSKSTSNYTVYKWITEAFDEKWHQQNHQQKHQQKHQQSTGSGTSSSTTKKKEKEEREIEGLDAYASNPLPQTPRSGKGERGGKEAFKYQGKITNQAFDLHKFSVDRNCACSADKFQFWLDELDGNYELLKREIENISKIPNIVSPPGLMGMRVANLKRSFKPEIENREEENKKVIEAFISNLSDETRVLFKIGKDFVKIKFGNRWNDIFYASPTFILEWSEAKKEVLKKC